jgi:sugar lactone lactonase YvrE
MPPPEIRIVHDGRDRLGEGPSWDERAQELVRVDITGSRVHGWSPTHGPTWTIEVEGEVGAAVLREEGGLVLAIDHTLVLRDADGTQRTIATVEENKDENRFNDCRADPQGRLWAGTMSRKRTPGSAALYRMEPGGELEQVLGGTAISNGIGWSPDGHTMYFIDSPSQKLDAFDFEPSSGVISNRRTLAEVDPADGLPDGLTVDAEGGIWVALFAGGALRRYGPDGTTEAQIELPLTNPTCPAFGGPRLDTLYVTTAWHKLTPEQHAAEPQAGALVALEPGVRGLRRNRFAG